LGYGGLQLGGPCQRDGAGPANVLPPELEEAFWQVSVSPKSNASCISPFTYVFVYSQLSSKSL
ncbi:unnamed protein product, partial [Tetraodon nigroviridis]